MTTFTAPEIAFLRETRLARLATLGPDGAPQVRPVGFLVDEQAGTLDIPGLRNPSTQKWRNVLRDPRVALVVDDVVPDPWQPRALEIRGVAEALPDVFPDGAFPGVAPGVIRIHPRRILVLGVDGSPAARTVDPAGR
ncbi:PPOX class F420-dependent oxidoreductase [Pseudonocardia sp.]|uniref:PPOX class F420-dependent oxidoreductase n=1 Tax=Pseudonocardia sp. TaxID=60912 RepID=UPI003D0B8DB3